MRFSRKKTITVAAIVLPLLAIVLLLARNQGLRLVPAESNEWLYEASYVGPETCGECHTSRWQKFQNTAHFKTAMLPDSQTIAGSFAPEKAHLQTGNPNLHFEMLAGGNGFYQKAVMQTPSGPAERAARIDFVIGSGKLGQTYLFWNRNMLFQLPVSYLTSTDAWVNSPGYPDGVADFTRPILPRCLECHATYFEARSHKSNMYGKDNFIIGITCERCHGPGSMHVDFQRQNPDSDEARFIQYPGDFSRQRLIDLCAQCHSGQGVASLEPPFAFRPGEDLSTFITLQDLDEQHQTGVHAANQVARLSKSACFRQSEKLTCITCHNPHLYERGKTEVFSKRCMQCHEPEMCGMAATVGAKIRENCIDCHMPTVQDSNIDIETTSGFEFPLMPDHFIGVYPDIAKRELARLAGQK